MTRPDPRPTRAVAPLPVPAASPQPQTLAVLFERLDEYARAAAGAFAQNTERALAADTRVFAAWCGNNGHAMLPASPETVAAFVDAQAELKAPATVARYRASIAALHRAAGLDNPCQAEAVRLAIRRMNRAKGRRQKQAEPLNRGNVERMLGGPASYAARNVAGPPAQAPRLIDLRDAALIAVAYDTLLRRSELVSLRIEDLQRAADGSATILVRRTKTDQDGEGAVKYLAPDTLRHLEAWLAGAWLLKGPVFRPVDKLGRAGDTALEAQEVRRLFQKLAANAGVVLPRPPSGHSTRVGAAQDMLAAGLELGEVMQAGSWKSVTMVARYGERLLARRGAARKLATVQNRA